MESQHQHLDGEASMSEKLAMTVDRADAVNLVFDLREYGDNAIHKITMHGLRCLFDAIERMDAALKEVPSEKPEMFKDAKIGAVLNEDGSITPARPVSSDKQETPRTDAAAFKQGGRYVDGNGVAMDPVIELVHAHFARRLERELAEARAIATRQMNDAEAALSATLPTHSTVEMQELICDHIFGDWRREDARTQATCRAEAAELYDAIVASAGEKK